MTALTKMVRHCICQGWSQFHTLKPSIHDALCQRAARIWKYL